MLEKLNGGQDLKEKKWHKSQKNKDSLNKKTLIQLEVYKYKEREAHLREERPLVLGLLDAVGHQPFHGFGAVFIQFTEVWGQIAPSHHVDYLRGESHRQKR